MGKFNKEYLLREQTESSDSQTFVKELPRGGNLSDIDVRFAATNGSTSNKDNFLNLIVKKVEIITDGSDIIVSLDAESLMRMNWLESGQFPQSDNNEENDAVQFLWMHLPFGRFRGDPEWNLPLERFNNVDLKIDYDLAAVTATSSTTAYVSGTTNITAIMTRAPKASGVTSRGYQINKEIRNFTSVASGEEEQSISVGKKYLGFSVFAFESAVDDNTDINRIRIDINKGDTRIVDYEWDHLQALNTDEFKVDREVSGRAFKSDTDTIETLVGQIREFNIIGQDVQSAAADTFEVITSQSEVGGVMTLTQNQADITAGAETFTAGVTDNTKVWSAKGNGVGNFTYVNFDYQRDFRAFLDATTFDDLDIVLTNGGAGAEVRINQKELVLL